MTDSEIMIATYGLSKSYGDHIALQNLDLEISSGELFCFLGPNGAGKTTTIKILTGLLRPSSGSAEIGGYDIQHDARHAKQLLGYVPDHPFLYPKLTGREFLRFVGGLYELDPVAMSKRSEKLLERFEIAEVGDRLIENYSHGMQQKLSFAACFLHDPKIVVVDEPWVGLDPKNIRALKTYLRARADDGLTIFMSTHTLSIAEELADRIAIIDHGKLLHTGTVAEIKALASDPGSLEDVFLELTAQQSGGFAADESSHSHR